MERSRENKKEAYTSFSIEFQAKSDELLTTSNLIFGIVINQQRCGFTLDN